MSMLMAGEVLAELCALPGFMSKLQLDKFFDRLWAYIKSVVVQIYIVQACLVGYRGSDWRPFVHNHDLSGTICCGVRLGKLPGGRIGCHFQAFHVALPCSTIVPAFDLP